MEVLRGAENTIKKYIRFTSTDESKMHPPGDESKSHPGDESKSQKRAFEKARRVATPTRGLVQCAGEWCEMNRRFVSVQSRRPTPRARTRARARSARAGERVVYIFLRAVRVGGADDGRARRRRRARWSIGPRRGVRRKFLSDDRDAVGEVHRAGGRG